jgi:hypothetical protein
MKTCILRTTLPRSKILLLLIGTLCLSCWAGYYHWNKSMATRLVNKLDNKTIRYATESPAQNRFVSVGRQIKILEPVVDISALSKEEDTVVPALIHCLDNPDKDWAANLILFAMTGRDPLVLSGFEDDITGWRKTQKEIDRRHWISWWETTRKHDHRME